LRVPEQIVASDVVMMSDLGTAHAAEKFLCPIRASAVEAVGFLVVDALHFKAAIPTFEQDTGSATRWRKRPSIMERLAIIDLAGAVVEKDRPKPARQIGATPCRDACS